MGKIQDAIKKVRRGREEAVAAESAASVADGSQAPEHEPAGESIQSDEAAAWSYDGPAMVIDRARMVDAGLLDPDHARKHLASEYRQIKRSIVADTAGSPRGNLLMVTSAERGEGRSFICLNLAMSLAADTGFSVVLVDSDVDNPRLSTVLGLPAENGLLDLIEDPSLDEARPISGTDVPGLAVLAGGRKRNGAAGMLASERATGVFDQLASADPRRVFIFDTPPVLSSAWPQALSRQVGQVLFVVQAGATPKESVLAALAKLDRERSIRVVLNQVID